jgi:hypothetical protein
VLHGFSFGIALVALLMFVLSLLSPVLAPLQERRGAAPVLLLWNIVAVGTSFEILEYSTKHGELAGPAELCAYLLAYFVATLLGLRAFNSVQRRQVSETQPATGPAAD